MIPSTLCTSLDIEYLNENGIIMRERRIISKLHLFIDEYTSLLNKPYIEGEEKFLSSPLRSFDVAVSISTEACQTYAIHSFTGIGYRIFAHTQQLYDKSAQIHSKLDRSCTLDEKIKISEQVKTLLSRSRWNVETFSYGSSRRKIKYKMMKYWNSSEDGLQSKIMIKASI